MPCPILVARCHVSAARPIRLHQSARHSRPLASDARLASRVRAGCRLRRGFVVACRNLQPTPQPHCPPMMLVPRQRDCNAHRVSCPHAATYYGRKLDGTQFLYGCEAGLYRASTPTLRALLGSPKHSKPCRGLKAGCEPAISLLHRLRVTFPLLRSLGDTSNVTGVRLVVRILVSVRGRRPRSTVKWWLLN